MPPQISNSQRSAGCAQQPLTTRERILQESAQLFGSQGYLGTSTHQIARAVGIKQPSIFHHFPSGKADIMRDLLRTDLEISSEQATKLLDESTGSPEVRLFRFLLLELQRLVDWPYAVGGIHYQGTLAMDEFAAEREIMERHKEAMATVYNEGVANDAFLDIDSDLVVNEILGAQLNVLRLVAEQSRLADENLPDSVASLTVRSFLRRPSRLPAIRRRATDTGDDS